MTKREKQIAGGFFIGGALLALVLSGRRWALSFSGVQVTGNSAEPLPTRQVLPLEPFLEALSHDEAAEVMETNEPISFMPSKRALVKGYNGRTRAQRAAMRTRLGFTA